MRWGWITDQRSHWEADLSSDWDKSTSDWEVLWRQKNSFMELWKKEYLLFFMTRNFIAVIPSYYELGIEQIPPLEVLASSCAVVYADVVLCSLTHGFLLLSVVSLLRMFLSNFGFGTLIISLPLVALSEPFLVAFPCTCQLNRILTNYCRRMKLEARTSFCSWLLSNFHCKLVFFFILFSVVFLFSPPISDWSVSVSTAWADCLCLFHSCMPKAAGLTPLPFLSHLTKGCCISTQANVSDIPFNSCGLFF